MTSPEESSGEMTLEMPFVACVSQGGLYDDDAYAAGYEAGQLECLLAANNTQIAHVVNVVIHAGNRAQADLIAMRHGYSMAVDEPVEPEFAGWLYAAFTKINGEVHL